MVPRQPLSGRERRFRMATHSQRPWNVLWLSIEDNSPRYGCYGDPIARTPNIDRLAAEGRRYTHAFSTSGVCAPSRCTVITGMYHTALGAHHMRTTHRNRHTPEIPTPYAVVPPPYVKAFPEYLRAAGYYCTNNSKTDYQFPVPLTAWDECDNRAHWRHRAAEQPFFAVFNPTVTHESGMWARDDRSPQTDPDSVQLPPYLPNTRKAREALARHYDNLSTADRRVGEILVELDQDGLADSTIVFLWSDHGEGLPRAKRWLYDAGIRVPLIIRWPGHIAPGDVSDDLVSLVDLAPTVLSVAGVAVPAHVHGHSFLEPEAQQREYVFAARDRHDEAYDMVRAVRDRRFKYIRNFHPEKPYVLWIPYRNRHPVMQEMWRVYVEGALDGPQRLFFAAQRPPEELYDLDSDPHELHNLAADPSHPALARLRAALDVWRARYDRWGDVPEEHMVAQMWPGGSQPKTAPPTFIPIAEGVSGEEAAPDGGTFSWPAVVQLHCATHGASIAYTTQPDGESVRWSLYTEPIRLPVGSTTVRARAVRIGYEDSAERAATFVVRPRGLSGGRM
jgi:arylsulfatase A-like enzyme